MLIKFNKKFLISIIIVVPLISVAFTGMELYNLNAHDATAFYGPKINIALTKPSNLPSNANVTESIQIMSANPSYLWPTGSSPIGIVSLPPHDYTTVFNKSFFPVSYGKTMYSGFLNYSKFYPIMMGWQNYYREQGFKIGSNGQEISMQVEATLSIQQNGNLSVYSYYNNILFNPLSYHFMVEKMVPGIAFQNNDANTWFNNTAINMQSYSSLSYIPVSFNLTPSFSLAKPTYFASINTSSQNYNTNVMGSPDYIPPPPCYVGTKYLITQVNVEHGPFPLINIHDNATSKEVSNYLFISESLATSAVTMCMTSDQTGVTSGGSITDQMSTSPSWGGDGTFSAGGQSAGMAAYPFGATYNGYTFGENNTTAVVYISNATFTITHYDIYYSWKNSQGQCFDRYLGNTTSVVLTSIYSNNNNFVMGYGFVPIEYYYIMQNVTSGEANTSLGHLAPSAEIQGGTIWGDTTGYSTGASEMRTVSNALSTFAAGLGVALAFIVLVAALNGPDGDASEPVIVDAALGTLNTILALSIKLLTDFSSISFSTDSNFGANLYYIESLPFSSGYSYNLIDYQSLNLITFNGNGNTYSFYGPSNFIVAS